MTTPSFYQAVMRASGDADARSVRRASAAVLRALRDRLTPDEAAQVAAQLPQELKKIWWEGEASGRRPLKLTRDEFFERVRGMLTSPRRRRPGGSPSACSPRLRRSYPGAKPRTSLPSCRRT